MPECERPDGVIEAEIWFLLGKHIEVEIASNVDPLNSPVDCSRGLRGQASNSREEMRAVRGAPISFLVNRRGEFIRRVFHEDISGIRHEDLLGHQWFPQDSRCIRWI